jgi:uncharacterized protein
MIETIQANPALWLSVCGLLIGSVFGAIVFRFNFCTMGALSDITNLGDWRRFRSWVLAVGVAVLGALILDLSGIVRLSNSMYLAARLNWLGNIAGGLLFGFGMVMAGGCVSRNLARAGGGDLRSLLTLLVLGLAAYMTIGGVFGPFRVMLETATAITLPLPTQSIGDLLAHPFGASAATGRLVVGGALGLAALVYCFADDEFRNSPEPIIAGLAIGVLTTAGWAVTGLAFDEFADRPIAPVSLTFVRPTGDTIEWLGRFTANPMPGFGVATVIGTIFGAAAAALLSGRFRVATFSDARDTLRHLGGGLLMGIGGVLALGCTIGQGVTGLSTLALGSVLTVIGLIVGAHHGLRTLERWVLAEA